VSALALAFVVCFFNIKIEFVRIKGIKELQNTMSNQNQLYLATYKGESCVHCCEFCVVMSDCKEKAKKLAIRYNLRYAKCKSKEKRENHE
jgi:hypothetical protein